MDYESVVHLFIGHESHDRSTNNVILEKQSITSGQPGGGAKTAPLEIAITLNPTVLPDKKKLLPYKKVGKQTWGRRMILLRAEDLVRRLG